MYIWGLETRIQNSVVCVLMQLGHELQVCKSGAGPEWNGLMRSSESVKDKHPCPTGVHRGSEFLILWMGERGTQQAALFFRISTSLLVEAKSSGGRGGGNLGRLAIAT